MRKIWAFAAVILVAMVLRPAVTDIGPLLQDIQRHWHLGAISTGLLTSMPVFCFGVGAFAAPYLAHRFGVRNTMTIVLAILALGMAIRVWFSFEFMLVVSIVVALAIALGNVLFPTIIRSEFPNTIPRMTALYTFSVSAFASVAAFTAVPLGDALGGFQQSLFFWFWPAALTVFVWIMMTRTPVQEVKIEEAHSSKDVFKAPVTWAIMIFFGLQSSNFYSLLNWLPSLLKDSGFTATEAGNWLGITTVIGVPVGMVVTRNLKKINNHIALFAGMSIFSGLGFALWLMPGPLQLVGCIIAGIGQGTTFPLSMALIATKARNQRQTTLLSAIAQGGGYLIAAVGTFATGWLFDLTSGWVVPVLTMVAVALVQAASAFVAASKRTI